MTARWFGYLSSTVAVAVLALNPEFATQGRDVSRLFPCTHYGSAFHAVFAPMAARQRPTLDTVRICSDAGRTRLEPTYSHWALWWCRLLYCWRGVNSLAHRVAPCLCGRLRSPTYSFPSSTSCWSTTHEVGRGNSTPTFRFQEVKTALGVAQGTGYTAVVLFVATPVLIGLLWVLRRREGRAAVGAVLVVGFGAWIVAPAVLAPRFFDWTLPGIAFLAAAGTWRVRASALVLPGIIVLSVLQFQGVNAWDVQRYAWTQAAAFANSQAANGHPVCVPQTISDDDPFVGYTRHFILVENADNSAGAPIVLQVTENVSLLSEIESQYTLQKTFPAWFPAEVWVRR